MIILGLIGEQGSGKGTVAEYLVKKHKAKSFRLSKILDDILQRLYIPNERKNQIALVTALRSAFGEALLAPVLAHDISAEKKKVSVVDGLRMPKELEVFEKIPGFYLIYITAPIKQRYEQVIHRGEKANEESLTFAEFKRTEQKAVTEIHIRNMALRADFKMVNDGTKKDLYRKVDEVLLHIKKAQDAKS